MAREGCQTAVTKTKRLTVATKTKRLIVVTKTTRLTAVTKTKGLTAVINPSVGHGLRSLKQAP